MKRSYKGGKFDSPAGLAVIIGAFTQQLLFVGIRNEVCGVCDYSARYNPSAPVREHISCKNWGRHQSSRSMETDAILEGFRSSIEQHGLIYAKLVGDGDSSVHDNLKRNNPYADYDVGVKKIECIIFCVTSATPLRAFLGMLRYQKLFVSG